ncbi:MAG: Crp/Fnr family transcriptional regulator [Boseongicola sp.]|nr:Crp/Fnr family transcriptional regulator [Boseongicola sp.]MDD9976283.1 Crp/Fnr family transcriptional regulator [Boseongicola sp.]
MLRDTGFLANASPALMDVLKRVSQTVELNTGEILFSQGDSGDTFYVVTNGALDVSVVSEDGRKLSLCIMRNGEGLGEISLFDPSERTATATALEPTTLNRISAGDLRDAVTEEPQLAVDLLMLAGRRMRWMSNQISEQALLPLSARLARRLIYLTNSAGPDAKLEMSHARLAEFVGATREAVSRMLSDWKKDGIVELTRGGLTVEDDEALEIIAFGSTL